MTAPGPIGRYEQAGMVVDALRNAGFLVACSKLLAKQRLEVVCRVLTAIDRIHARRLAGKPDTEVDDE